MGPDGGMLCIELGRHNLRGRVISLRWLEHKPLYDAWSPAHYTWITIILFTVTVIIITVAFKYRHTVSLPACLRMFCYYWNASCYCQSLSHDPPGQCSLVFKCLVCVCARLQVMNAVIQCSRALCTAKQRRWNAAASAAAPGVDEVNTLLAHAQV